MSRSAVRTRSEGILAHGQLENSLLGLALDGLDPIGGGYAELVTGERLSEQPRPRVEVERWGVHGSDYHALTAAAYSIPTLRSARKLY